MATDIGDHDQAVAEERYVNQFASRRMIDVRARGERQDRSQPVPEAHPGSQGHAGVALLSTGPESDSITELSLIVNGSLMFQ